MLRRFNNIVSAAWYQAPAHEGNIRKGIQRGQLSDCIQQKNSAGQGFTIPRRSSAEADRHLLQQRADDRESLWMPRRKNHHRSRMLHQHILKCFQQQRLFSIHRAAAHQHRPGGAGLNRRPDTLHNRRGDGGRDVELQISAHAHAVRPGSEILQPRGVPRRLCKKQIDVRQQFRHPLAKSPITRPGAVRDARVHNCNSRAAAMSQSKEVGPELGFRNHHHLRPQCPQVRTNRECEIHGEVKYVSLAKASACQGMPRVGRG